MCQRDAKHDYRAQGSYMITLSMARDFPLDFGRVLDASDGVDFSLGRGSVAPSIKRIILYPPYNIPFQSTGPAPQYPSSSFQSRECAYAPRFHLARVKTIRPGVWLSDAGALVRKTFTDFFRDKPEMAIRKIVMMPDHIHFILKVKSYLEKHLGTYVGALKGQCTASVRDTLLDLNLGSASIFEENFHDRIIRNVEMYERELAYLDNNPKRLLLRKLFPDAFRSPVRIWLNGAWMSAYGNLGLLDSPIIDLLVVRSRFGASELSSLSERWERAGRQGGVVVSPLISPKEKEMCKAAVAAGASVIRVMDNGFPPRYKPASAWDELLVEGRYLEIGQEMFSTRREYLHRSKAMAMNRFARSIAHSHSRLLSDL